MDLKLAGKTVLITGGSKGIGLASGRVFLEEGCRVILVARDAIRLAEAGAPVDNLQVLGEAGPQFHPGQSATLRLGPKTVVVRFGALHPARLAGGRVVVAKQMQRAMRHEMREMGGGAIAVL